jgi:hypothetical protein
MLQDHGKADDDDATIHQVKLAGPGINAATRRKKRETQGPTTPPAKKRDAVTQKVFECINQMSDQKLFALADFLEISA